MDKGIKRLLNYYKKYLFLCIAVIILSLTYAVLALLAPILEGKMLGLFETLNFHSIVKTAIILTCIRILIEILTNQWSRAVLKLNGSVSFDLKKDHTIVIVAHRLSTIVDADNIYVLHNHKIVDNGIHKALIKRCMPYKDLYQHEKSE